MHTITEAMKGAGTLSDAPSNLQHARQNPFSVAITKQVVAMQAQSTTPVTLVKVNLKQETTCG